MIPYIPLTCLPVAEIFRLFVCLLMFYLHHQLFFLEVPFSPHSVPRSLCCSLSGVAASNTLFLTLALAQLSSPFPFLTLLLHGLPFASCFPPTARVTRSPEPGHTAGTRQRWPLPPLPASSHEHKVHTAAEGPYTCVSKLDAHK